MCSEISLHPKYSPLITQTKISNLIHVNSLSVEPLYTKDIN
ncbi:hypothetical protein FOL01_p044 (plasmid) [Weissella jogaejeotgali]|uniref:Uncharacterized protein n=1 Tax=Weissella jogaejeotgali TaxID=1631871 RepID=A0A1L6REE0_9LACO|nr:hypothetical protein FOL01_p044 [Weissella jogaejeotgali]